MLEIEYSSNRVFHSLYKVGIKGFNKNKRKLPPVMLKLIKEIITG